ncbi:MAG: hypothetical protein NWQ55_03750 [Salibacteraceae bacterium]|jgi:hypothetical protein|nr:hypothetical protein [Salibacteraceae bacterium]MDP4763970.1 hypothetical protein [Salibacteraceae bacterium]MDP4843728.1 hypothetical protein [Salibacteraceae bacterium]MDP4934939.1 hypothetical protein [Salibacteraceae bacterium]MDP4964163.1 hypothetical protein [Salibacteraceae bacterium]
MHMSHSIQYFILDEFKLIIEVFSGPIFLKDLIDLKQRQLEDSRFNSDYNSISDLCDAKMNLPINDIKTYIEHYSKMSSLHGNRKCAILTSSPKAAAIAMVYRNYSSGFAMSYEVFTTVKATLRWIDIAESEFEVISRHLSSQREEVRLLAS